MANGEAGRPEHEPTDETRAQVTALASVGIRQEEIARFLDIDPKTLRKHYRREIDIAAVGANQKAARRLFERGVNDGDVTALIFWLKTKAGFKDSLDLNVRQTKTLNDFYSEEAQDDADPESGTS